ncbi:MAG: hypothetical protein AB1586_06195 [Pseudomonadota bacterium]
MSVAQRGGGGGIRGTELISFIGQPQSLSKKRRLEARLVGIFPNMPAHNQRLISVEQR